ncbi:hypothetical protein D3C80_1730880 [compost metagenome]
MPDILAAARGDDLIGTDGAFILAITGDKAGLRQHTLLVRRQCGVLHRLGGVDQAREVLRDGIDAFDDLILYAALVRNADLLEPFARDHAVGADEAQHAREHLIG